MGGKDAIVVADDADIDSAATGIVQAAFGFQGQKCSACSRLIVDEKVHDELLEKIVRLTEELNVGQPTEGETSVAAVINKKAFDKTLEYIKKGVEEGGEIAIGGTGDDAGGYFILPTIIDNVKAGDTIEQEEIFARSSQSSKLKTSTTPLRSRTVRNRFNRRTLSASAERLERVNASFIWQPLSKSKMPGALVACIRLGDSI